MAQTTAKPAGQGRCRGRGRLLQRDGRRVVQRSYERSSTMAAVDWEAVPPVPGGAPLAVQLPFAADPGSLTGFLLENSSDTSPE